MDNLNHQNCQLMSVLIILKNSWIWRALKLLRRSESPAQVRKCLKTSWWNKRRKQFHNYLPYNINGTVSYKAVASTRAKLLQRMKDVRPWKKDSRTTWSGYETVQYRNCSGSFTCVITESVSFFQYDKANNVHFTKTGTYKKCLDKNNNIFQTTRFNHTMIFFKLTDQYRYRDIYTTHHNCLGHMLITQLL